MNDCTRDVLSGDISKKALSSLPLSLSCMQTTFTITGGEINAQESKMRIISHTDLTLCTFQSKLAAL